MCVCCTFIIFFFFSSRRRHTRWPRDWSSDVCSSDLGWCRNVKGLLRSFPPVTPEVPFVDPRIALPPSGGEQEVIGTDHPRKLPHVKRWTRERALPRFLPGSVLGDSPCPVVNGQGRCLPVLDRLAIDPVRSDESLGFPDSGTIVHATLV